MAIFFSPLTLKLILVLGLLVLTVNVDAHVDETTTLKIMAADTLEWPMFPGISSRYEDQTSAADDINEDEDGGDEFGRRSLFWHRARYYISYGALSANRIPCPPRSGRSYYTHNCYQARGPVHPYTRGCSMITRCRR